MFRELIKGTFSISTSFKVSLVQIPSHTGAVNGYEAVPKFLLSVLSIIVHNFPGNSGMDGQTREVLSGGCVSWGLSFIDAPTNASVFVFMTK